ncbi:MAG: GNAT family N-acetyltransferase [Actinobacteria bacterium]|nr:GNAT family N-acetyltransferase [Actinomycetota bacterium]
MVESTGTSVVLRPLEERDVEALVRGGADGSGSFGPAGDEARKQLLARIERRPTLEDGGFLGLVIEALGEVVGDIQARAPQHAFPPGVCEIGITLFAAARGRGLGLEAVRLFTESLLDAGWPRVQASTALDNAAMRRVLERCGYAYEGTLRSYAPGGDGGREDYAMYARFRSGDAGT